MSARDEDLDRAEQVLRDAGIKFERITERDRSIPEPVQ